MISVALLKPTSNKECVNLFVPKFFLKLVLRPLQGLLEYWQTRLSSWLTQSLPKLHVNILIQSPSKKALFHIKIGEYANYDFNSDVKRCALAQALVAQQERRFRGNQLLPICAAP
ncbi:hypothetical protein Tco_0371556 [Tanacetum coccineum]